MSYEEDKKMCDAFVAEGAVFPKVLPEEVQKLFETLRFETHVVPNTTTTVCRAILPVGDCEFVIATGEIACIDKRNFNPTLGAKYAKESCEVNARKKLRELEGYYKAKLLADSQLSIHNSEPHEESEITVYIPKDVQIEAYKCDFRGSDYPISTPKGYTLHWKSSNIAVITKDSTGDDSEEETHS